MKKPFFLKWRGTLCITKVYAESLNLAKKRFAESQSVNFLGTVGRMQQIRKLSGHDTVGMVEITN